MKTKSFIWTLLWKTSIVAIAVLLSGLGASGVGFHGAELIVKLPFIRVLVECVGLLTGDEDVIGNFLSESFGAIIKLSASTSICLVPIFLIYRIAKPVLFIMVPILLWVTVVGARNGIVSDFDVGRALSQ